MELSEALRHTDEILDEERTYPTARYRLRPSDEKSLGDSIQSGLDLQELGPERGNRPREIKEESRWSFESTNYTLLMAVAGQLEGLQRRSLSSSMLARFQKPPACARSQANSFPSWQFLNSELPLLFEFFIRNGYQSVLFQTMADSPLIPGHVVLFRYIEEMIALNFTALNADEYSQLSSIASTIAGKADTSRGGGSLTVLSQGRQIQIGSNALWYEVGAAARAVVEQCRKARYLYLKGALVEGVNLEINQDKTRVENYLQTLGFEPLLVASLTKADELYQTANTPFDLKSSMGHLRSFMEQMHAASLPDIPQNWGQGLVHLRQTGLISDVEERFVADLYTFISDEAVHPLIAEREYARLARNMVIEYGLLFLTKLQKSGLREGPKPA